MFQSPQSCGYFTNNKPAQPPTHSESFRKPKQNPHCVAGPMLGAEHPREENNTVFELEAHGVDGRRR